MSMYLARFTLTPETWASLCWTRRRTAARRWNRSSRPSAKLHGYWYAFGDADGYVLGEWPDDVVAASTLAKVAASGAFASLSTTKLLTVEEMLTALHGAGGVDYRAPARPGS